ncbi:MAG: Omp28-related outer membrane protein [Chitinophagaceae bacterium]|nr:Omp28-related outer membrane protein [Chitinophagaceae bacterium]
MKHIFIIFCFSIFFSCKEKTPPGLELSNALLSVDSSYTTTIESPQLKTILVEEFTGVKCANCPEEGAEAIVTLMNANPNRIIPVAIHAAGTFSEPLDKSKYDFRTKDGDDIRVLIGGFDGNPAAAINRVYTTDFGRIQAKTLWSNLIASEIEKKTPLNISAVSDYDVNKNTINITTKVAFTSTVDDNLNLLIYVIENDITDAQEDARFAETILDYKFKHLFRKCITSTAGSPLNFADKNAGTVLQKRFSFEPTITGVNKWNLGNCHLVVFVTSSTSKEVIHTIEIPLK